MASTLHPIGQALLKANAPCVPAFAIHALFACVLVPLSSSFLLFTLLPQFHLHRPFWPYSLTTCGDKEPEAEILTSSFHATRPHSTTTQSTLLNTPSHQESSISSHKQIIDLIEDCKSELEWALNHYKYLSAFDFEHLFISIFFFSFFKSNPHFSHKRNQKPFRCFSPVFSKACFLLRWRRLWPLLAAETTTPT